MTEKQANPYDLLGGEVGVRALVDRFYDLMDDLPEAREIRQLHPADLGGSRRAIAIGADLAVELEREIGQAACADLLEAPAHLLERRRCLLERGDPVQHVVRVDRVDRGQVARSCGPRLQRDHLSLVRAVRGDYSFSGPFRRKHLRSAGEQIKKRGGRGRPSIFAQRRISRRWRR